MAKRIVIWFASAIAAVCVAIVIQRIKRTEMRQEGQVAYHRMSGDLIQFFTRELQRYGGTHSLTGGLPVLNIEWGYADDTNGFQILIAQTHRAELVRAFTSAFGEPLLRDKYPHLVYRKDRIGLGIIGDLQSDPIHIICLRRGASFP